MSTEIIVKQFGTDTYLFRTKVYFRAVQFKRDDYIAISSDSLVLFGKSARDQEYPDQVVLFLVCKHCGCRACEVLELKNVQVTEDDGDDEFTFESVCDECSH